METIQTPVSFTITDDQIRQLQQTIEQLEQAAGEYATHYNCWPLRAASPAELRYIDRDSISFAVDTYCRGYSETESISVPFRWFTDRDAYIVEREQDEREWAIEQARRQEEEAAAKAAAKEEKERATYERLKAKFEGGDS